MEQCRKFRAKLDDQWLVDVVYVLHLIDLPIGTLANLLSHNKSLIDDGSLKFRAIESVNIPVIVDDDVAAI